MITCNQGTEFKFQEKPKCNDIGMCNDIYSSVKLGSYSIYFADSEGLMFLAITWQMAIEVK